MTGGADLGMSATWKMMAAHPAQEKQRRRQGWCRWCSGDWFWRKVTTGKSGGGARGRKIRGGGEFGTNYCVVGRGGWQFWLKSQYYLIFMSEFFNIPSLSFSLMNKCVLLKHFVFLFLLIDFYLPLLSCFPPLVCLN